MRFDVVTIFPEMFRAVTGFGVTRRACESGLTEVVTWDPRGFASDRHRSVDDRPYGGGPGMVMAVAPLLGALRAARQAAVQRPTVVYLSPQGRVLDQSLVAKLAIMPRLVLLCGRYEGVDERLLDSEVDVEISVGDYVVSGGELPAMLLIDAVSRMLPGVLGHAESAKQDSFMAGILDCPHYTRPEEFEGRHVPAVLLGGDHQMVNRWRHKQALGRTWLRRPELLEQRGLTADAQALLQEFIDEYRGDSER